MNDELHVYVLEKSFPYEGSDLVELFASREVAFTYICDELDDAPPLDKWSLNGEEVWEYAGNSGADYELYKMEVLTEWPFKEQ